MLFVTAAHAEQIFKQEQRVSRNPPASCIEDKIKEEKKNKSFRVTVKKESCRMRQQERNTFYPTYDYQVR
jgi:hypothetical protein